jgi:Protein of unknown function (DUF4230)
MQRKTLLVFLGALLILAAVAATTGYVVWRMTKKAVVDAVFVPEEKTVDIATLVTQVRELNRLETASMRVMHVGTITQSYRMVPNAMAGDEITFLATGDVIAGIDLAQLRQEDVWRSSDGTINVRLPKAQVLVTRVDNAQSRVLSRKTGVLRRRDIDLETRARQHAEENIRSEAVKRGVLKLAGDNAEKKMADLLHTFGADKVRFVRDGAPAPPLQR